MKRILIYDDFNATFPKNQDVIGTVRQTFANRQLKLMTNGVMGAVTTFATKDCIICEVYD